MWQILPQSILQLKRGSVPIRGLFNLTLESMIKDYERRTGEVSVPIRGLFNLTNLLKRMEHLVNLVSVPIRGLFNLTNEMHVIVPKTAADLFPSPSGDYLI